jgi:hypothetical protein
MDRVPPAQGTTHVEVLVHGWGGSVQDNELKEVAFSLSAFSILLI